MCKLYDPLNASNNFIEKGILDNEKISPMKLQKLLYFLYRDYLKATHNPLFSERFEAWKFGPVLSCVYDAFKSYGSNDIKTYYVDKDGRALKINEASNDDFSRALNNVWNTYKHLDGIELSKITHRVNSAWYKAWTEDNVFLTDEDIANEEVLQI